MPSDIFGDEGPEHEDTEAEHEEATPRPAKATGDTTSLEEGQKEDDFAAASPPEVVRAATPATVDMDSPTAGSCSDDLQQASNDCGEEGSAEAQGHQRQNSPRSKFTPSKSSSAKPRMPSPGTTPGSVTRVPSDNGSAQRDIPDSPLAAMIPHISMVKLRGPRPAPALGGKPPNGQQARGPLRDLITWLDDADVGDMLDEHALTELLPAPSNGIVPDQGLPHGALPSMVVAERAGVMRPEAFSPSSRCDSPPPDDGSADEDDFEEVPSEKECLPRAPPLAPSAAPLMRPLSPDRFATELQPHQRLAGYCANPGGLPLDGHNEEEEWFARQRLTGAICRLVRYNEVDYTPKDDILGLRCTRSGRIMVTAVRENGIAAKAGVVAGDELVSIDGRKEFIGHTALVVHASLRAPTILVFLGFVGKLQAEVRVKRPPEPKCGLAPGAEVIINSLDTQPQPLQLRDAVVFKQGDSASMLITAEPRGAHSAPVTQENTSPSPEHSSKILMYELQREDARNLIVNALGTTAAL